MENSILNIFKNKPIEMIFRISSLVTAFIIFTYKLINYDLSFYLVTVVALILIYAFYARIKLDYEMIYTKIEIFKLKFSLINGHLILKSLYFIIISLMMIWYNSNPFQKEKINCVSIILVAVMAICLVIFVKIKRDHSNRPIE